MAGSKIQKNSYWVVKDEVISVFCETCHEKDQLKGWFWIGTQGYGNYDCKCKKCGEVIHQRGEKYEDETIV